MSDRAAVEAHKDAAYALCLRWTGDPRRAESIALSALRGWLKIRVRSADPIAALYGDLVDRCARVGVGPGDALPPAELRLHRALGRLDTEERSVLLLRDISGLDIDQVARTLGLSRGSALSRLQRARMKLARRGVSGSAEARTPRVGAPDDAPSAEDP